MEPIEILERVIDAAAHLERGSLNLEAQIARLQRAISSLPSDIAFRIPRPSNATVAEITKIGSQLPTKLPQYRPTCFLPMTLKQAADEWRVIADGPGREFTDSVSVVAMARGKRNWESAGAEAYGEFVTNNHIVAADLEKALRSAVRAIDEAYETTHDWMSSVWGWFLGSLTGILATVMATINLITAFITWVGLAAEVLGGAGAIAAPGAIIAMSEAGAAVVVAIVATAALYYGLLFMVQQLEAKLSDIADSAAKVLRGPVETLEDNHPWFTPGAGIASSGSWQG